MNSIVVLNYIYSEAHVTLRAPAPTDCAFSVADLSVLTVRLQKSPYNLGQLQQYQLNSNEEYTSKKFERAPQVFAIFISHINLYKANRAFLWLCMRYLLLCSPLARRSSSLPSHHAREPWHC